MKFQIEDLTQIELKCPKTGGKVKFDDCFNKTCFSYRCFYFALDLQISKQCKKLNNRLVAERMPCSSCGGKLVEDENGAVIKCSKCGKVTKLSDSAMKKLLKKDYVEYGETELEEKINKLVQKYPNAECCFCYERDDKQKICEECLAELQKTKEFVMPHFKQMRLKLNSQDSRMQKIYKMAILECFDEQFLHLKEKQNKK